MKAQERLDKIMDSCIERMQEEVSALLGKTLSFTKPDTSVLSKEDFFSQPAGKTVFAHVRLEGDFEGQGALLVSVKDAIRIGGTLIMLPDSELDTVIAEEEYTGELEDSYGEIANIICGAMTVTFDEQYPKNVRLVRTEQEVILPVKVDVESDEPVPDGSYYVMTSAMKLESEDMGPLQLLLPAIPFGLVEEPQADPVEDKQDTPASGPPLEAATDGNPDQCVEAVKAGDAAAETGPESAAPSADGQTGETAAARPKPAKSKKDVRKQKERIDTLLAACLEKTGEELGALLGGELKISPLANEIQTKESLLDELTGKQVLARMEVRGEGEGESYLFVGLKDAIYLGGTLIMLPEPELEEVVRNEEFGEDAEDAYGEIANIIAGVYTAVFEEQYRKKLGFVKTGLDVIVPVKIDPDSDETLPDQLYYLSGGRMHFNGNDLGPLQVAFAAELLELEGLALAEEEEEIAAASTVEPQAAAEATDSAGTVNTVAAATAERGRAATVLSAQQDASTADILIVTDDDAEARRIAAFLEPLGHVARILHFKDAVTNYLGSSVQLIYLVMQEVSEQGFGVAIKISSSGCRVPMVAAGPAWTRTRVLKAVKYGASDILITPASEEDVREKIETNLARIAA